MEKHAEKSEKTILVSVLMSAPGPILTGIGVILSQSTTQLADFIRRTAELIAMTVSLVVYRKLHGKEQAEGQEKKRLEIVSQLVVGTAMIASGILMAVIAVMQAKNYQPADKAYLGLIIAGGGFFVNMAFWIRYYKLNKKHREIVTENQEKLYLAKSVVDFFVTIALLAVTFFPEASTTVFFDLGGSILVAIYLVWSGAKLIFESSKNSKT